jgi:hypothetical protein
VVRRFLGSGALTLALTLGILPTVSVLCCAWSVAGAAEAARPSCHQGESSSGMAALQAAHECAPASLALASLAEGQRRMLAAPVPQDVAVTTEAVTPVAFVGRRPHPAPILHVPKHLLHVVLLI